MPRTLQNDFLSQRYSRQMGYTLSLILIIFTCGIDIGLTYKLSFSVLFIIPLIILAQTARGRRLLPLAFLLVLLTYACFLLKIMIHDGIKPIPHDFYIRLFNRSLAAGSIVITAFLLHSWIRFREYWADKHSNYQGALDSDEVLYDQIFHVLEQFMAIGTCVIIASIIFAMDILSPNDINAPLLYFVPLFIIGQARNRLALWLMILMFIILSYVGFIWGPPGTTDPNTLPPIGNRSLAVITLIMAAVVYDLTLLKSRLAATAKSSPES